MIKPSFPKSNLQSYLELSFAQSCIGFNIIIGKVLTNNFPLFVLLSMRFFLAFIMAFSILFFTERHKAFKEYKSLSVKEWAILVAQALCGGFLFNIFVLYGLKYTTATITGIINSAVPALVGLFSYFILREKLTREKSIAIALCVLGIIILGLDKVNETNGSGKNLLGIFLILMAVIPEALYTIFAKLITNKISPMANTVLMNLVNLLACVPFIFTDQAFSISDILVHHWMLILFYSLSTVFFFWFWQRGVATVSANTAALFMGIMPISTTLMAYFFLRETLSLHDAAGLICIMFAIYLGTNDREEKTHGS